MRAYCGILIAALTISGAGCSGCGDENENNGPDQDVGYILIDAGDVEEPIDTCDLANPTDVPVVALNWNETIETYLAPNASAIEIAVDYEVTPAALVERIELDLNFDPRLTGVDPGDPDSKPTVLEERCPTSIELAEFTGVTDQETVVTATVSASHEDGTRVRHGLISLSTGTVTSSVVTDGLDAGAEESEWYYLFEPISGLARITLAPANLSRTTFSIDGIPDETGVIALIQTDELRLDSANQVIYAPPSFGSTWRQRATGWYGRHRTRGEDSATDYPLTRIVAPDQPARGASRPLSGDFTQEFSVSQHLVLETLTEEDTGTMTYPCDLGSLELIATGFVEVDVDDGTPRTVVPGGTTILEPTCDGDTASVTLTLRSRTQRPQAVLISVTNGEE